MAEGDSQNAHVHGEKKKKVFYKVNQEGRSNKGPGVGSRRRCITTKRTKHDQICTILPEMFLVKIGADRCLSKILRSASNRNRSFSNCFSFDTNNWPRGNGFERWAPYVSPEGETGSEGVGMLYMWTGEVSLEERGDQDASDDTGMKFVSV